MGDLIFTSALWPLERSSGKKVVRIYEADSLIEISARLEVLAQKVDHINAIQAAEPKCRHCGD